MLGFIQTKKNSKRIHFWKGLGVVFFYWFFRIVGIICIYKPDPFTSYYYSLNALSMENMSRSHFLLVRLFFLLLLVFIYFIRSFTHNISIIITMNVCVHKCLSETNPRMQMGENIAISTLHNVVFSLLDSSLITHECIFCGLSLILFSIHTAHFPRNKIFRLEFCDRNEHVVAKN